MSMFDAERAQQVLDTCRGDSEVTRLLHSATHDAQLEASRHVTDEHPVTGKAVLLDEFGIIEVSKVSPPSSDLLEIRVSDAAWYRRSDDPPGTIRFRLTEFDVDVMRGMLVGSRTR